MTTPESYESRITQDLEGARHTTLDPKSRERIRGTLMSHIAQHPVRNPWSIRRIFRGPFVPNNHYSLVYSRMAFVLVLALLLGGGTTYAAGSALPGDVLYPIKVGINERTQSALALSANAEASLQARLAAERLEEAEELAAKGALSSEHRAELAARFTAHTGRAKSELAQLKADQKNDVAASVSSDAEASLKAHGLILQAIGTKYGTSTRAEVEAVLPLIRAEVQFFSREREDHEYEFRASPSVDSKTAAEGKMTSTERKIAQVRATITANTATAATTTVARAQARLATAESVFAQGKTYFTAENYNSAFISFLQAMRIADEAKIMIVSESAFDVEIGERGSSHATSAPSSSRDDDDIRDDDADDDSSREASVESRTRIEIEDDDVRGSNETEIELELPFF